MQNRNESAVFSRMSAQQLYNLGVVDRLDAGETALISGQLQYILGEFQEKLQPL